MSSWTLLLPAFLLAFSPTLVWMIQGWFAPGTYFGHGPLVVAAGLWFLFERDRRRALPPSEPSPAGLAFLLFFLLVHLSGQVLQVDSLSGAALVPCALALIFARDGFPRLRALFAPVGLFFFAVPLPLFVSGRLAYEMKHLATTGAVTLGNLAGLGLRPEGARIWIPGQELPLLVGDACSGLRSLVALLALGWVFAFFLTPRKPLGRVVFILLSVPLALFSNFVRIAVLAALARTQGVPFASGTAHQVSGYLIYLGAILLLILPDLFLPWKTGKPGPLPAPAPGEGSRLPLLAVLVLGLPAAFCGLYRPPEPPGRLSESVPREIGAFSALRDHEISERWYRLLGTRDVCWRDYRDEGSGARLTLTLVFHGRNWKAVHPPDTCLQASGFEIQERWTRAFDYEGGRGEMGLLRAERGPRTWLVAWLYGGPGWIEPGYLGFFLRNLPGALLCRPTRGYLLRADLELPEGAPVEEGRRQLERFLREFLPVLQGLLER